MVDLTEQDYRRRLYVMPEKIYTEQMGIKRLDRLQTPEQKDYIRRITKQSELKKPYQEDDYQDMEYHLDLPPGGLTIPQIPEEIAVTKPPAAGTETKPPFTVDTYNSVKINRAVWQDAHDAITGDLLDPCNSLYFATNYYDDPDGYVERAFMNFDLSDIRLGAIITEARLFLKSFNLVAVDFVVQKSNYTPPLAVEDFDDFYDSYISKATAASAYGTFYANFNADGIAYFQSKIGVSASICFRQYDYDYLDVQPPTNDGVSGYISVAGPCYATVALRPVLILTVE